MSHYKEILRRIGYIRLLEHEYEYYHLKMPAAGFHFDNRSIDVDDISLIFYDKAPRVLVHVDQTFVTINDSMIILKILDKIDDILIEYIGKCQKILEDNPERQVLLDKAQVIIDKWCS